MARNAAGLPPSSASINKDDSGTRQPLRFALVLSHQKNSSVIAFTVSKIIIILVKLGKLATLCFWMVAVYGFILTLTLKIEIYSIIIQWQCKNCNNSVI